MSIEKETNFFTREKSRGENLEQYARSFSGTGSWRGEASPVYTMHHEYPGVAERIHAALPEARLIYVVRDPIARAVSQYQHDFLSGRIGSMDFPGAFQSDLDRFIMTSRYHSQIMRYASLFDKSRIHVLDFDLLKADPQAALDSICAFLGAAPHILNLDENVARNRLEDRGRTPTFILKRWNSPVFRLLRSLLPRSALERVRSVYRLLPKRNIPQLSDDMMRYIRDGVLDDASKFRQFTGKSYSDWSV